MDAAAVTICLDKPNCLTTDCTSYIDNVCAIEETRGFIWERYPVLAEHKWFKYLCLASGFGYALIVLAILYKKELQVHPMPLIGLISAFDGALMFLLFTTYYQCWLKLYMLFEMTFLPLVLEGNPGSVAT